MAGRGGVPKDPRSRVTRHEPVRGEIAVAPGRGWQHGDVPGLRTVVRLYDQVERGEFHRAAELRLSMDTYGITPKGQQDRRWRPPQVKPEPVVPVAATGTYGGLRSVPDAVARKRKPR